MCATQTAIIVLNVEEILIWKIPPLSPQPPNFSGEDPTLLPPDIRVEFPDCHEFYPKFSAWRLMSSWYIDNSRPLHLDKIYIGLEDSHLDRFKITIKPDLSDVTLHFLNTLPIDDGEHGEHHIDYPNFSASMLCEDTLVSCWNATDGCGLYTGSMLSRPPNAMLHGDIKMSLPIKRSTWERFDPICPASGRVVYVRDTHQIVVLDFLPH